MLIPVNVFIQYNNEAWDEGTTGYYSGWWSTDMIPVLIHENPPIEKRIDKNGNLKAGDICIYYQRPGLNNPEESITVDYESFERIRKYYEFESGSEKETANMVGSVVVKNS